MPEQTASNAAAAATSAKPARSGGRRFNLEMRQRIGWPLQAAMVTAALAGGLFIAGLILVWAGVEPSALFNEFVLSIFGSSSSMGSVMVQAAPLILAGLGAAIAFQVRFWNIGIEGQMIFGAIAATLVAITDIGPPGVRLVLMAIAAALFGMAWIAVPALLRLKLGVNEIISTLLLNYVAFNFLLHLLYGGWKDPKSAFPNSEQFEDFERLPKLGWETVDWGLPLALLLALVLWWLLSRSRFGFFMRFINANEKMAFATGVPVLAVTLSAVLLSGALAGLAGFVVSAGIQSRLTQGFFIGYGFSGILIAFLARNNAIASAIVAVFVAVLFVAGQSLQVFYQIPAATVQLIQAIIVMTVAASEFFIRHRLRWLR